MLIYTVVGGASLANIAGGCWGDNGARRMGGPALRFGLTGSLRRCLGAHSPIVLCSKHSCPHVECAGAACDSQEALVPWTLCFAAAMVALSQARGDA